MQVETKDKAPKLPKSAAACADLLYSTRVERLKLQRDVEKLERLEGALKDYFVQSLPKSQATGIAGRVARVQVSSKPVPAVKDWDAFYAHIKRTGSFELLQRRVGETAVKERWDAGKQVPGVERFNVPVVSCTAIKGGA